MRVPRYPLVPVVLAIAAGLLAAPASATPAAGHVVVATANVYEGAVLATPRDLADRTDIRRFARRFAALNAVAPDVVALQEVRGSLAVVVRHLNRAMRGRATYAVVTRPGLSRERGRCDGQRGRFTLVRDGAIVVNTATTSVLERGTFRTWGRWLPGMRGAMRRADAAGCAEHPWARVRVTREGLARDAVVVGTHVGPMGHHLKTRAMGLLAEQSTAEAGPDGLVVIAGDLNLPWCIQGSRVAEAGDCRAAAGHEQLAARGFLDALRTTGHALGSVGRVDFIQTGGQVLAAGWDRCYRPRLAPSCGRKESAFATERAFRVCNARAVFHGRPGDGCGPRAYGRYYSDHPIVTATVQ